MVDDLKVLATPQQIPPALNVIGQEAACATFSKNLSGETKLPIAPYVGVSYGTYEHRWLSLAGLTMNVTRKCATTVIYDGVRVHPLLNYAHGPHVFSFVLAFANQPGVSYSISF